MREAKSKPKRISMNPVLKFLSVLRKVLIPIEPDDVQENMYVRRLKNIKVIWNGIGDITDGTAKRTISINPNVNFGIQRVVMLLLDCLLLISPLVIIQGLLSLRRIKKYTHFMIVEAYTAGKPILLFFALWFGYYCHTWVATVATVWIVELFVYQLNIAWVGDIFGPIKSPKRSMMLLTANFLELVLAFAIFYLRSNGVSDNGELLSHWYDGIYFSIVTAATVGFGDFTPSTAWAKFLVALQIVLNFIFATIIIFYFSTRFQQAEPASKSTSANGGSKD